MLVRVRVRARVRVAALELYSQRAKVQPASQSIGTPPAGEHRAYP